MDHISTGEGSPLKFAHKKVSSPVSYCSLTIGAGTRDENLRVNGLAHCLEHMLFKGTSSRSATTINSTLESLGGELNAYTTKEETVIHATTLTEHLPKALGLISDMVFSSLFPDKELEKEKEVILEEISSCKDNPSEQIFEDFDSMIFGDHPLSMPILGTPASVKRITANDIREFSLKHFHSSNISLTVVADISEIRLMKLVERFFGHLKWDSQTNQLGALATVDKESVRVASLRESRERVIKRRTHQTHCIIGSKAYSLYDEKRVAMAILTNILGGPALNSRLNILLRERNPLVYTVDATYTPYRDTGLFTVYYGTDRNNLEKATDILMKELTLFREREISEQRLKAAKKQLIGQMAISLENGENLCLSMGKSLLAYNFIEQFEQMRDRILRVNACDIMNVACEVFNEKELYTLVYK